jgi:hypothetical protein
VLGAFAIGELTGEQFMALWEHGLLPEKLEFLGGQISAAPASSYVFGMREAREATKLGIRVHSAVDAVLADEQARVEVLPAHPRRAPGGIQRGPAQRSLTHRRAAPRAGRASCRSRLEAGP